MTNILRHLRDGVIAWLTGPVAAAGIQMPERWDLRGIIGFVLQILGLTWARVREKLVRLMGARVVGMLEAGFQLILDIRDRGLVAALRDRVTEFFGSLREAALGAIRSFIQQRLVQAGITQLLSLLSPVGAVIQAIIKTYTTIQFFIQRINQILDLVESVVNSIAAIASGAIGAAASFVERTMARTIPVILDFLARFIGLGDVGAQVQTTIRNLQASVDRMLDRAVEWIRTQATRLGTAVAGSVRRVVGAVGNWWRRSRPFRTRNGEQHEIAVEGTPPNSRIVVRSEPRYLDDVVRSVPAAQRPAAQRLRDELVALMDRGRSQATTTARGGVDETVLNQIARDMDTKLQQLTQILVDTDTLQGAAAASTSLPTPTYSFQTQNGKAHVAQVRNLSANRPMGSEPFEDPLGWDYVHTSGQVAARGRFVRMHLINHRLGGLGRAANLAPGPTASNRDHLFNVERAIKGLVGDLPLQPNKTAVITDYTVRVTYRGPSVITWDRDGIRIVSNMSHFPETFHCSWTWKDTPAATTTQTQSYPVPIGVPMLPNQTS